jgi:hypothetical protein
MHVIFSREAAERLKDSYTVLELETFEIEGRLVETFCVVTADKMNLAHMPTLDNDQQLHARLIEHVKKKDYKICLEIITHLRGRFGGELDSFYDEIEKRSRIE